VGAGADRRRERDFLPSTTALNRPSISVELVVLVIASVTVADVSEIFNELHTLDPIHLLKAELGLAA